MFHIPDWLLFHDKPLPRRNCHPILGNKEKRNGKDASRAGTIYLNFNTCIKLEYFGTHNMLC